MTSTVSRRDEAVAALESAIVILDEIGEAMAAIHVSHAIELLQSVSPQVRAEAG